MDENGVCVGLVNGKVRSEKVNRMLRNIKRIYRGCVTGEDKYILEQRFKLVRVELKLMNDLGLITDTEEIEIMKWNKKVTNALGVNIPAPTEQDIFNDYMMSPTRESLLIYVG